MVSILFAVALLLPSVKAVGPFMLYEVQDHLRPGRGRHRRVARGRNIVATGGRW